MAKLTRAVLMAFLTLTMFASISSLSQILTTPTPTTPTTTTPTPTTPTPTTPTPTTPTPTTPTPSDLSKRMDSIEADLKKQNAETDFSLQLGIGSLVRNGNITDYNNNANSLASTALGWATPQYLVGVSLRAPFPNFRSSGANCTADALPPSSTNSASGSLAQSSAPSTQSQPGKGKVTPHTNGATVRIASVCPIWKQRPWGGFLSLKFSSSASQTLNGYVLGGSYQMTPYLNFLVGFALTPVNVPSPGLRTAAANFVTQQQTLGNYLNFDPVAMRNNKQNAFDGFSLLDSNGKLIYTGTPLEIDYRGGMVIGIAIPLSFSDFLQKGK